MKRITIEQARKEGYTVDTHCYPYFAYKGARFSIEPSGDVRQCYTELEAELLELRDAVATLIKSSASYHNEDNIAALKAAFDKLEKQ